jgi:C4-dicarboxylate-specific signal transduction histidine kinase
MLLALGGGVLIASRHLSTVELLRKGELEQRNAELEALRQSLEDRVARRTLELQASHLSLDHAFQRLKANQSGLLAAERMAAIGRLTAGVAHEMSSPLSATRCSVDELEALADELERSVGHADVTEADLREIAVDMKGAIELAQLGIERATLFLKGIKAHTVDRSQGTRTTFDAVPAVRDSLVLLGHAARAGACSLSFEPDRGTALVVGASDRMMQVVTNVVSNALHATADRGGGAVKVRTRHASSTLVVEIEDEGGGIPEDVLPRIFEPMFTTKAAGRGMGLGLSIVEDIVKNEFGGRIEIAVAAGAGSTFAMHFPTTELQES